MNRVFFLMAIGAMAALCGCVTETYIDDQKVDDPERYEAAEKGDKKGFDLQDKKIEAAVEAVNAERGSKLLQTLQWLVAQKQLAHPAIFAALPEASTRARANLLYVLGYTKSEDARRVLAEHLGDKDEVVRYEAAAGLIMQGDMAAVPILIDFLGSKDRQMRYKAIESLRSATGRDFGYQFAASAEARGESVAKWSDWWGREKGRLMRRGADERTAGAKD